MESQIRLKERKRVNGIDMNRIQTKIVKSSKVSSFNVFDDDGWFFREIDCSIYMTWMHTVWKNIQKRDHAEIFSVKSHSKNLRNWLVEMHAFLPLGGSYV